MADPKRLEDIVRPYATVADRIRALDAAGVARADIARFLGKRYQHVRNVLEGDAQSGGYVLGKADLSGVQEGAKPFGSDLDEAAYVERRGGGVYRLVVRADGALTLPREVAEALNVPPSGGVVIATLDGKAFNLVSVEAALEEAQEIVARHVPKTVNLADSFLANRRAMWGEEDDIGG